MCDAGSGIVAEGMYSNASGDIESPDAISVYPWLERLFCGSGVGGDLTGVEAAYLC